MSILTTKALMRAALAGALIGAHGTLLAQVSEGEPCAASLVASVELLLPPLPGDPDPRDLTCNGIVQLHFILTAGEDFTVFEERERILAVFRRQGLSQ